MSDQLIRRVDAARISGKLLGSAAKNLNDWIASGVLPEWAISSLEELVEKQEYPELNDRFFRYLAFGTGGMRGRTIGAVATAAETGTPGEKGTPEHPAVGSNLLNEFTVIRATVGLFRYTEKWVRGSGRFDPPKLVIAHDVRHFSPSFCELVASTWSRLGGTAFIFDGPRSTPQLSFSVSPRSSRSLRFSCRSSSVSFGGRMQIAIAGEIAVTRAGKTEKKIRPESDDG
jgi:phosphoglucomutase